MRRVPLIAEALSHHAPRVAVEPETRDEDDVHAATLRAAPDTIVTRELRFGN